jgi:hypothetical protein
VLFDASISLLPRRSGSPAAAPSGGPPPGRHGRGRARSEPLLFVWFRS